MHARALSFISAILGWAAKKIPAMPLFIPPHKKSDLKTQFLKKKKIMHPCPIQTHSAAAATMLPKMVSCAGYVQTLFPRQQM